MVIFFFLQIDNQNEDETELDLQDYFVDSDDDVPVKGYSAYMFFVFESFTYILLSLIMFFRVLDRVTRGVSRIRNFITAVATPAMPSCVRLSSSISSLK